MHIHDYRENSHPVSPSPPHAKLPSKSNENTSPFNFAHNVSRSRMFTANNSGRTKEGNDTYLSTAVTPLNEKFKARSTTNGDEIKEFKFPSRDNEVNEDKENKSPAVNSRGHSMLGLKVRKDLHKDSMETEAAWVHWSNNSRKGRNNKVEEKATTLLL